MKKVTFIVVLLAACIRLFAQEPDTLTLPYPLILSEMNNVMVTQDESITRLMQSKEAGITLDEDVEIAGYRVQIFSDNTQGSAKAEAMRIEERFKDLLEVGVYVLSVPPFIKVRLGDFRTQAEALAFKNHFVATYPDMQSQTYVVRDEHIKVKKSAIKWADNQEKQIEND